MSIDFVYFDLGNVLVSFDPEIASRNLSELAGVSLEQARHAVYGSGLQDSYELGDVDCETYARSVRHLLEKDDVAVPQQALLDAISNMFTPINEMVATVQYARRRCGRVGVLSNTCPAHWSWVRRQPWPVSMIDFDVTVLSCEVYSMKPDWAIYDAAERAARTPPEKILFVDDKQENVDAARNRGWNAERCLGGDQADQVIRRYVE